ncbi:MAG: SGNH/GDSL hydrolase family protein [Muribaculaceae bacterium]|nr:SGNH/GDSL hydrolase family protein [Muribaculaceae bacterium]
MKRLILILTASVFSLSGFMAWPADDWAQFGKYAMENDSIKSLPEDMRPKVVFMGNSITEGWVKEDPDFFKSNNFLGRGISGQTTYQMLDRFREDVINLKPEIVVITAGTNDVAENNHNYNEAITVGNIISMAELARINNIKVVLTSVPPTDHFYWNPQMKGIPEKLISLNEKIRLYSESENLPFADYFSSMSNEDYGMKEGLSIDGVHPSLEGYKIMEGIILPILTTQLYETKKQ